MHMTKTVKVDFFCDSKKWPRRVPKIKKITKYAKLLQKKLLI